MMTITCQQFVELIIDFVGGDLAPEQCQVVEQHLLECTKCVVYLETYQLTIKITRRLPCKPLPPACEARLRETLARAQQERQDEIA